MKAGAFSLEKIKVYELPASRENFFIKCTFRGQCYKITFDIPSSLAYLEQDKQLLEKEIKNLALYYLQAIPLIENDTILQLSFSIDCAENASFTAPKDCQIQKTTSAKKITNQELLNEKLYERIKKLLVKFGNFFFFIEAKKGSNKQIALLRIEHSSYKSLEVI